MTHSNTNDKYICEGMIGLQKGQSMMGFSYVCNTYVTSAYYFFYLTYSLQIFPFSVILLAR